MKTYLVSPTSLKFRPSGPLARLAALFLLASSSAAFAQTSLSIGNAPGYPGATVRVPVNVSRATNVVGAQFDVSFNPAKAVASAPALSATNIGRKIRSREVAPGVRRTVVYSLNNSRLQTNGAVALIPFQVPAHERIGSGPLVPSGVLLAQQDGASIAPVSLNAGTIFIRPVNPLPDGSMQFFLPAELDERYIIQATTDFLTWLNLTNVTAPGSFMDLIDEDATRHPHRFYRWLLYDAAGEIGALAQSTAAGFGIRLDGLPGRTYVLQASTNLQAWTDVSTNVAVTGTLTFTNLVSPAFPHRFFRVRSN